MIRFCFFLFLLSATIGLSHAATVTDEDRPMRRVALYGNTYKTSGPENGVQIDARGVHDWTSPKTVLSVWFALRSGGELELALCGCNDGVAPSRLEVSVAGERFEVDVQSFCMDTIRIGRIRITEIGYLRVDLRGLSCRRDFGRFTDLLLSGEAAQAGGVAVPVEESPDNWPYWGRRGPSVHMGYTAPSSETIRYFYNEITVPEGNDVLHSYYMANGFDGGYMGMQVNGPEPEQRRILFSVWSVFASNDPAQIPEAYRVRMLRKGAGVHVGEFGNEGSGGQSYLYYPWKAGKIYRFITEVVPDDCERTRYTGYFCDDDGVWHLIAAFMCPEPGKKTEKHYTGMHSFLENFDPEMGPVERRVRFGNQWAVTTDGRWIELTEGRFAVDHTGGSGIRLDYDGGVEEGMFYLRNCGFFVGTVPPWTTFSRPATGKRPCVDLDALAAIPSSE